MENKNKIRNWFILFGVLTTLAYIFAIAFMEINEHDRKSAERYGLSFFELLICVPITRKLTIWLMAATSKYGLQQNFTEGQVKVGYLYYALINMGVLVFSCVFAKYFINGLVQIPIPVIIMYHIALRKNKKNLNLNKEKAATKTKEEEQYKAQYASNYKPKPDFEPKTVIPTQDFLEGENLFTKGYGSAYWISNNRKNELTDIKYTDERRKFSGQGLWIGGGFFNHKEGNLCSIAPPGKGKGAALILPNLLWSRFYPHSFVVFDPKGTNACITARHQQNRGQKVIIIDPMGIQEMNGATHDISGSCYNPLDEIVGDVFNGASLIANLLLPDDPKGEKFWNQKARDFIQAVLMHVMTDDEYEGKRNLITFYKLIKKAEFNDLFLSMSTNLEMNEEISHTSFEFANMMKNSDKTFYAVLASVTGAINWLGNPSIQKIITKSDFKARELESGGISLYLCQPIQNKEQFATFSRLIIGSLLRKNAAPSSQKKAWVYYLLDEFPSMGVFPEVVDSLALAREYKMRIWLFAQSLSQLDEVYTASGRNRILGNMGILQAFGVSDYITQEYISKRVGKTSQTEHQQTTTRTQGRSSKESNLSDRQGGYFSSAEDTSENTTRTENANHHERDLITPDEVERDANIITLTEWGPMRLSRWQYWQNNTTSIGDQYYKIINDGRADKNPNI